MSTPTDPYSDPRQVYADTYFAQDRSNNEEISRLQIQDQMTTASMGGVLPEQPNPTTFSKVLDVGCGTGGWLIETAKSYPGISLLVGIDASRQMVKYARRQAEREEVNNRVEFTEMDALTRLDFTDHYFNLVNERHGASYLRTWDWPKLLQEFGRVTRPGGIIRLTESDIFLESTSPALTRLQALALEAFYRAEHYFTLDSNGVTSQLERLLQEAGFKNVQTRALTLEYRAGTSEGEYFYTNMKAAFRVIVPFLKKWTQVPEDYEAIYQQALVEMQQTDFMVPWKLLTAWGENPDSTAC